MSTEEKPRELLSLSEAKKMPEFSEGWVIRMRGKTLPITITLVFEPDDGDILADITSNGVKIEMHAGPVEDEDICRFFGISLDDKVWEPRDLRFDDPLE